MAKFGKKYRNLQIEEWKPYYINYKLLKQKIKSINNKILSESRDGTLNIGNKTSIIPSLGVMPIANRATSLLLDDLSILYLRKYGQDLKEFIELLDDELNKCYLFYLRIEKEIYKKVNMHLYTQTHYINYNLFEIYIEICKLKKTVFLIKCVNSFINENMSALKNILKKFDNKLSNFCGRIQTKYILHQLTQTENNQLEHLLQFKTIDEALTILESILKELLKYCNQNIIISDKSNNRIIIFENPQNNITDSNQKKENEIIQEDEKKEKLINDINTNNNNLIDNNNEDIISNSLNKNNIKTKINDIKKEILEYLKEIDELTYFKIQYGDWFYYLKEENDKLTKHSQKLLENDIFNPILSASYKNDNIIMKFLSKKDGGSEIKEAQISMSFFNKLNIALIIIHSFFFNTLITCIYPLLFIYIKKKNENLHIYSFLIIAFTYLSSFFFMIIYHHTKIRNIKITYIISYFLFFIGSLGYLLSIKYLDNLTDESDKENGKDTYIIFTLIFGSRILIGLGDNTMMGKKYITIYSPRFYVSKISLYFIIFQILGMASGPIIGGLLLYIGKEDYWFLEYNNFNCIGWYGCIGSLILIIFNFFFFTKPDSSDFFILKNENLDITLRNSQIIEDDIEDAQDKEYHMMQKDLFNKKQNNEDSMLSSNKADDSSFDFNDIKEENQEKDKKNENKYKNSKFSLIKRFSNIKSQKNLTIFNDLGQNVKRVKGKQRTSSLENVDFEEIIIENNDNNKRIDSNPLLITVQKGMDENDSIENKIDCDFNRINMIPRAIDDIIRKEKITFGYLNHNLLVMFLLLFFNNMIKENYIAFLSYYKTETEIFLGENFYLNKVKYTCFLTGATYFSELFSIFFIIPFHKINRLFKKYLIILMIITNILMISLSILIQQDIDKNPYYPIISLLILFNMIIEVISSSYLSYLLPPGWKFSSIRAGALTVYIMTLGKIAGCLFCFISFKNSDWNYFGITIVVFLAYTIISIYLYKSTNLRIKPICRIMQQKKLYEFVF